MCFRNRKSWDWINCHDSYHSHWIFENRTRTIFYGSILTILRRESISHSFSSCLTFKDISFWNCLLVKEILNFSTDFGCWRFNFIWKQELTQSRWNLNLIIIAVIAIIIRVTAHCSTVHIVLYQEQYVSVGVYFSLFKKTKIIFL